MNEILLYTAVFVLLSLPVCAYVQFVMYARMFNITRRLQCDNELLKKALTQLQDAFDSHRIRSEKHGD